ncbi:MULTISPECIES: TolC family protein [Methylosinus]|uniref:TolC family protein n=1 Tax=Methylosinus trichosporium (strain ATCC 35070 / NCIMB 11131 / UNIQEM 75 / OB3b) TaxID=595536 RepID=A0A2D2D5Z2_METT3|nr:MULTISPECIES: TolC family protein [Methylosinus]ATQ70441.1 TolC family protein [Methylosinus trichosporium OB3b]
MTHVRPPVRVVSRALVLLAALLVASPALAAKQRKPAAPRQTYVLARHLDIAVDIDAPSMTLDARHRAISARFATADSITPGSPYLGGLQRRNVRGNLRDFNETEVEAGMPLWLPGQRDAFAATVTTGLHEVEQDLARRRLEVARLLRDAWWNAQRAARDVAVARSRVATARDLGRDMKRRVELGDAAQGDALLAQNETLAAETELAEMEGQEKAARVDYMVLTGGAPPDGALEPIRPPADIENHPALRAPRAALVRAEAELRLIHATPIESPDIGVFGRYEYNNQYSTDPTQQLSNQRTDSTTVGVRVRVPLPTPGRNEPRIAEAQAEMRRATAEYERAKRVVLGDIAAARATLAAAQRAAKLATERLKVANDQFELSRKSFSLGEISALDLYRLRQIQLDAQRMHASAMVNAGAAVSRLNQAMGYAPGL